MHSVKLKLKQKRLGWSWSLTVICHDVFDIHWLRKNMVDNPEMCEGIIFADRPANNLGACCSDRRWSQSVSRCRLTLVFHLGWLLKKDFPEDVFFLLMRVVVLNIVVMRLVEDTGWVVVTVWILVSYPSHLVLKLSLRWHPPNANTTEGCDLRLLAERRGVAKLRLVGCLGGKVLASQEEHLLMKTTYNRNLRLCGLLCVRGSCGLCICWHGQWLLLRRGVFGRNGCVLIRGRALLLNLARLAVENLRIPGVVTWIICTRLLHLRHLLVMKLSLIKLRLANHARWSCAV